MQLSNEILIELTKLFKPKQKFKCYDDVLKISELNDVDLKCVIKDRKSVV